MHKKHYQTKVTNSGYYYCIEKYLSLLLVLCKLGRCHGINVTKYTRHHNPNVPCCVIRYNWILADQRIDLTDKEHRYQYYWEEYRI